AKPEPLDPALRRLSAIILLGVITSLLDTTIVTVAIGTLGKELHASVDTIQWVNTGYLLALGAVIPLTGWSIGRFGAKRMWIFTINLPVCLAAVLLAWRAMPAGTARRQDRLDVKGFALLSPGIAAIVYGFSEAGSHRGFTTPWVLLPLAGGCLLLTGFAVST